MIDRLRSLLPALLILPLVLGGCATGSAGATDAPVDLQREFRAVWVATVANIDWPSKQGLEVAQMKEEFLRILDLARAMQLNAIVLQVRPATDALYASELEPWSEFLTGTMGKAPADGFDPLAFAVEEAHARGLELHAWFNPYRSRVKDPKGPASDDHVSKTMPELVKSYGGYLWMDPGDPRTAAHSLAVIDDVVRRYDIDGVHLDDYFYPYPVNKDGKKVPFPDDESYAAYQARGGRLERDDFRREAVDRFVEQLYRQTKDAKPWVKVGLSPFGIARPGWPEQVQGFDQYEELYADARKWWHEGWVDYMTPQLYWPIAKPAQSYIALLQWWADENRRGRHLWPGNAAYRIDDGSSRAVPAEELIYQIQWTRIIEGASGNVHFSMKAFLQDRDGIVGKLDSGVYARPALVPASPWLDDRRPAAPHLEVRAGLGIAMEPRAEDHRFYVLYLRRGDHWEARILGGQESGLTLREPVDEVRLSSIDRAGNESRCAVWVPDLSE